MNVPRTTSAGVALAVGTAVISGLSVYLNGLFVKEFDDPLVLTTARNALVGIAFLVVLLAARPGREIAALGTRQRVGLLVLPVLGGSIAFFLFFTGLAAASGPGAAFIHKTLFVWVAILAVPLLGETLGWAQVVALGALVVGSLLLTPPGGIGLGGAELLLFAATLLWSLEVIVARALLPGVSVRLAASARMALGAALMLALLAIGGRIEGLLALSGYQWLIIVVTGTLLFGYVATWYGALQRAPASTVTSVLVGGAVVTGLLAAASNGSLPAAPQTVGLVVIAAAAATFAWLSLQRRPRRARAS
ncbi:MAG TPA: DMT family transporter [Candidatus Limnocylindrales bacterium]|nr:DMT family transporter [Candidatus Limnocylindrales bacterium]